MGLKRDEYTSSVQNSNEYLVATLNRCKNLLEVKEYKEQPTNSFPIGTVIKLEIMFIFLFVTK